MRIEQAIPGNSVSKKIFRYTLKTLAWILAILIVGWIAAWIYVINNEDTLKERVATAIEAKTHGEVSIGGLSVSFFRTFPLISLQLNKIVIRDSITAFAHKDFLTAEDIYLRISIPGVIRGTAPIGKILMRNGEINVVSDTLGNTNEYIFSAKSKDSNAAENKRPHEAQLPDLELKNVSLNYKRPKRRKDYSAMVQTLKCSSKDIDGVLHFKLNVKLVARNIAFNTRRGSFMKGKSFESKLAISYNKNNKDLAFNNAKVYLDDHPYTITGKFNLDNDNGAFFLNIDSKEVIFDRAAALLHEQVQKVLKPYSVMNPIDLSVKLSGYTNTNDAPLVDVKMAVRNNKVTTPQGIFENCSFNGQYNNELVKGTERGDPNSFLLFEKFTGRWENINFKSDTIKISNLITFYLECDVASEVDMQTLDKLADSKTFSFEKGKTIFDIDFKGPILGDSLASTINGFIKINNASVRYNPRNMLLSNCEADLKFVNSDLFVNKVNASVGKTKLNMSGSAANFLALLNVSPEKLVLKWKISSPQIFLDDFKSLLSSSSKTNKKVNKESTIAQTSSRIDKMFSDGDMYISMESPSMTYKTFNATGVKMDVVFMPSQIKMERVALAHAGGTMNIQGVMKNGAEKNPVTMHVYMEDMDIPQLFTAFNNFGQDAVTNKNLKGKISANVHYSTSITNKADLVTQDNDGTIDFLLKNGELNDFAPLKEISQKAFKKQDFSNIKFADLKNRLELKGTAFIVNSMDIRSTAINLAVEGVYDFKKGTDMFIRLPVKNLLKSQANTDISDAGKSVKGVSLRLRAKTGDDGKLKVSWDPFRLAKRNKKDVKDSAEQKE